MNNELMEAFEYLKEKIPYEPELGLVLGSGLGGFAQHIEIDSVIEYCDIPNFPVSTVAGHEGRFIFGRIGSKKLVCMQGRVHYYEGYSMDKVVMPARLMSMIGAKTVILTNAAGGINSGFKPGDLMMITDHISSFVPSPLIGKNIDELGTRFPDMSQVYDKKCRALFRKVADSFGVEVKAGVYIQLSGPNYETPAEIRMCKALGADAVGMSTAVEAMALKHCGVNVFGVSLITNYACGITDEPLSHDDVRRVADCAENTLGRVMKMFIMDME